MGDHAYFNQPVKHINHKWHNNRIESDHSSLKRITNRGKGFKTLRSAKGIEAFRTVKRGHLLNSPKNPADEIRQMNLMFAISN